MHLLGLLVHVLERLLQLIGLLALLLGHLLILLLLLGSQLAIALADVVLDWPRGTYSQAAPDDRAARSCVLNRFREPAHRAKTIHRLLELIGRLLLILGRLGDRVAAALGVLLLLLLIALLILLLVLLLVLLTRLLLTACCWPD